MAERASPSFDALKVGGKPPVWRFLLDGEWRTSRSGKTLGVHSPIDGSLVGRIQACTAEEVDLALTAASLAQPKWAAQSSRLRGAVLRRFAELLRRNGETIADLLTLEIGKKKEEALTGEIERTARDAVETAELGSVLEPEKRTSEGLVSEEYRVPVGVVVAIAPFNYPVNLLATKLIPALFAGNAVVAKPPTQGAIASLHLCELLRRAGLPDGVLNVVTGEADVIGDPLVTSDLTNLIAFTGSTAVGKAIAEKAGMAGLLLELGGKDPAIVLADADLDLAASEIVKGAFSFAGQRCTAVKRLIVVEAVHDALVERLLKECEKHFRVVGDPRDPKTQLGPVISERQADYLEELVQDALRKGAKLLRGGKRFRVAGDEGGVIRQLRRIPQVVRRLVRGRGHGNYFEATILDEVKAEMRIAWEEQFGPILPILQVKDAVEAVKLANASEYGLDAALFTKNSRKARSIAQALECGQVYLNTRPKRSPDIFPFTGTGASGIGTQGNIHSLYSMTRLKAVRT